MSRYPALALGSFLALGSAAALHPHPIWIASGAILILVFFFHRILANKVQIFLLCITACAGYLYTDFFFVPSSLTGIQIPIKGYLHIASVRKMTTPFKPLWRIDAVLENGITNDGKKICHFPCKILFSNPKDLPAADKDYYVIGDLRRKKEGKSKLHVDYWKPISSSWNPAALRFQVKEKVRSYVQNHFSSPEVRSLLSTLATGELEDYALNAQFAKIGLQHVLGISGAQFSLAAFLLMMAFRFFLPLKWASFFVLAGVSFYFFFIGDNPAVLRAWISIGLFLTSRMFHLGFSALNALGAGLIFQTLYNPVALTEMPFLLSYTCTAAILLTYPLCEALLARWLPCRSLKEIAPMPLRLQHVAVLCAWLRKAAALNLAVHACTVPILLYLFSNFPLASILYNLFFPFVASAVFLLFLIGSSLPYIGILLHKGNGVLAAFFLNATSSPLPFFNISIYCDNFPFSYAVLLPILLLSFSLLKIKELK